MSERADRPAPPPAAPQRAVVPNSTVLLATVAVLLLGFTFTVGCAAWSLDSAAGRLDRQATTALLYMGLPAAVAVLCLLGALARFRAANRPR